MEFNKIAGAVLLAGLLAMIVGKVSGMLYEGTGSHHGEEHQAARGYSIEISDAMAGETTGGAEAAAPVEIAPLLAGADAAAGGAYFAKKCATCHTPEQGGKNKTGPNLWGVVNRPVASIGDFKYSKAMAAHGGKWDYQMLSLYLTNPKKAVPGTMMAFAGIKNDQERANVIAYLRTLSPSPAPLP